MKTASILKFLSFILITLMLSCKSKPLENYSTRDYTPIQKIELEPYKSPQSRTNQEEKLALGIAISGGGSRAQYFSTGIFIGLDEIKSKASSFLFEIDYFSTVSGGGYGTGYFFVLNKIGVFKDYDSYLDFWQSDDRKNSLQSFMHKEAKSITLRKHWSYERHKRTKNSYPFMIDRELLQLNKTYKGKKIERLNINEFMVSKTSKSEVKYPFFVANGTVFNNGERFPFMPHILKEANISGSFLPEEEFINKNNELEFPLSYAIAGSAAFPGILPMLKLKISNNQDLAIRIVDGGTTDNLGYTTLFQLLKEDHSEEKNKKVLIVDCSSGLDSRTSINEKLKIGDLIYKSAMFTVDTKLIYANRDISFFSNQLKIDQEKNVVKIGIISLLKHFKSMENELSDKEKTRVKQLRIRIDREDFGWEDGYKDFISLLNERNNWITVDNVSEIETKFFDSLTASEILLLYELASQIETKVNIGSWEDDCLVLAGRVVIHLNRQKLSNLLRLSY